MIAKIAVSAATFAIDKPYSYRIPEDMQLQPGQRVQLPFGRGNRRTEGVVLSVEVGDEANLKCVERVLDESPILTRNQLLLAAFIRERYFCTLYDAIRAMLPAGLWFQTKASYVLTEDLSWKESTIKKPGAAQLLQLMEDLGGQAEEPALRACIADEEILENALAYLVKKKWVEARTEFQRRSNDKTEKIVTLAAPPEEAMAYAAARPKSALQQKAVLELLCSLGSVAAKEICYFTGAKMPTLQALEKKGYVTLSERPVLRCREIKPAKIQRPLVLVEGPDGSSEARGRAALRRHRLRQDLRLYPAHPGMSGYRKERHASGAGNFPDTPAAGTAGCLVWGPGGGAPLQLRRWGAVRPVEAGEKRRSIRGGGYPVRGIRAL